MASRTETRLTDHATSPPAMGTLDASANSLYPKGTIVCRTAAGRAYAPTTDDASGNPAQGIAAATFDNRTGSEMGGLNDSGVIEVDYGVFGFDIDGDDPLPGDTVYVVDNQTVSTDPGSGRGVAGTCTEVREVDGVDQCFVTMGPHVANEALARASALLIPIPLTELRLSTGAAIAAFSDGVADGFSLVDSEALGLRINDDSTTVFTCTVPLIDHDDAVDLVLHVTGFRVGAADTADVGLTVGAFFHSLGAAHTADANAGGETTAFTAATTIVSEETLTIAADDIPAGPCSLTLTFQVTSELDGDDLVLLAMWLTGAKK